MRRSSRMRLKVEGVDEILEALRKADKALQEELHDLISEAAEIVFREADANVPIKSGKARASLKIKTGKTRNGTFYANVTVGGEPFYITFYELGNSRQPPRPFMRPALDKSRAKIRQHLIEGLRAAIERQGK